MPCEARPNREQFARRAFARAPSAHPPTVARAPRTRNRAIVGVKTANAHALTPCDTMQTERPWSSCPRRFGHSGAAASRWGLCLFSRVRRRQHHPRAGFAEPSCRAARIEPEDHRPDPDPRKTCSGTPSWFPAVWPIASRHPSRSDSDAERPSGRYLTAGPMVRIRFPPPGSQQRTGSPHVRRPLFCLAGQMSSSGISASSSRVDSARLPPAPIGTGKEPLSSIMVFSAKWPPRAAAYRPAPATAF